MPEFGKTQLYVDSENIRGSLKKRGISPWFGAMELKRPLFNLSIDGGKLFVRRVIFYDAVDEQGPDTEKHWQYLKELGQQDDTLIRLGTVIGARNKRQKGVDMKMGRDMMAAARSGYVEYFALASGDADFIPIVEEIQDLGPKVLILAFKDALSQDLARAADRVIDLPDNSDRNWSLSLS